MRRPLRFVFPAVLFAFLLLPASLFAQVQATTGIIRGTITDESARPIAGAQVTVVQEETGFTRTVATNSAGAYVATLLPTGTYTVTASSAGFLRDAVEEGVRVRLGESVPVNLVFQTVELAAIEVEAEAPLVDVTDVTQSQRLSTEAVEGLPNNGRNFLDFTLLTPGAAIVQGPDGDELTISGQRGIFNNISVDGADFNNPFFGEQRGGQRPAFTFNLDAVEEMVVVAQGAPAEFGRSAGGFVNVLTKSGTNEFEGTAHYFGQFDELSADFARGGGNPDFKQHQFGLTLGGPIVRDKVFFFIAYDQQEFNQTKQTTRTAIASPAELGKLETFLQTAFGGTLANDFGPIDRTDDARALMVKLDWRLNPTNNLSLKYNYTWSEQVNGTFDVDAWALSANGIEKDYSHAINGALSSQLTPSVSNEFRFQWAREWRPRPYNGPLFPGSTAPALPQFDEIGGRPFPDTQMDFVDGFRFGLPFFLPIDPAFDTRIQLLDNVSFLTGNHLFKVGAEWNKTSIKQQFVGFANGRFIFSTVDGFINYVEQGPLYVTCSDGSDSATGTCPAGESITGPLLFFQQSATVPPFEANQLGLQDFDVNEVGLFIQDTWTPSPKLTINAGLRWEGTWHPDQFIAPEETFYAPFIGQTKLGQTFPSDGTIPNDLNNWQPRFGFTYDVNGDGRSIIRGNAGSYFSRIPLLVFAQHRTTNATFQQLIFRNSELIPILGAPPAFDELLSTGDALPFDPTIMVADKDLELPRTWSFGAGFEQMLGDYVAASIDFTHARTDNLFRFVNANDDVFGAPWLTGLPFVRGQSAGPADTLNGITSANFSGLTVTESTARSRYSAITFGLKGGGIADNRVRFEANYTLSWDKSDDDNERDPFVYRYARADRLDAEYNWSDRDQRHRVNAYVLVRLPYDVMFNNRFRYASAQPVSESCGPDNQPSGVRSAGGSPAVDRVCADGSVIQRNTLRKDNEIFSWDVRLSKIFPIGPRAKLELIGEVFNLTNTDNFLDAAPSIFFNFDGTIRSGLGDPRRVQVGARWIF